MNYSEMCALYRNKAKSYGIVQCDNAIRDIDETLKLQSNDMKNPYVQKLFCERDAMLDRKLAIRSRK